MKIRTERRIKKIYEYVLKDKKLGRPHKFTLLYGLNLLFNYRPLQEREYRGLRYMGMNLCFEIRTDFFYKSIKVQYGFQYIYLALTLDNLEDRVHIQSEFPPFHYIEKKNENLA